MATRGYEHVTLANLHQRTVGAKPSKYRNVKVTIGSETFDSKREAAYWQGLQAREKNGEIANLRRQVEFALYAPVDDAPFDTQAKVSSYVADFVYDEQGTRHVVDAKGQRTAMYQLKKKWLELQDGIIVEEV